jgi:hypothetical protein
LVIAKKRAQYNMEMALCQLHSMPCFNLPTIIQQAAQGAVHGTGNLPEI